MPLTQPEHRLRSRSLFLRYQCTNDPQVRRRLIERNLPLARRLARRFARSPDAVEELTQVASLGLVKAVDRFDPRRGVSFASFATPTILGELKRHMRDTRWAVHVPRDLQERAQRVERQIEALTTRLQRAPTPREVADAMGLEVEEVLEAQDAFRGIDAVSLDAPAGTGAADDETGETMGDLLGEVDGGYELAEQRAAVAPALAELSDRDRLALHMRFAGDMTQAEIGSRLGVSQMQVSRILRRALARVRAAADAAPA